MSFLQALLKLDGDPVKVLSFAVIDSEMEAVMAAACSPGREVDDAECARWQGLLWLLRVRHGLDLEFASGKDSYSQSRHFSSQARGAGGDEGPWRMGFESGDRSTAFRSYMFIEPPHDWVAPQVRGEGILELSERRKT